MKKGLKTCKEEFITGSKRTHEVKGKLEWQVQRPRMKRLALWSEWKGDKMNEKTKISIMKHHHGLSL